VELFLKAKGADAAVLITDATAATGMPEGRYRLGRRNPRSDYFLSIQVSYPNEADLKRAHRKHWDAGGSIMIHGLPNQLKHEPAYYETRDWTDGCIAVSNADMVEIWLLSPDEALIDILP